MHVWYNTDLDSTTSYLAIQCHVAQKSPIFSVNNQFPNSIFTFNILDNIL